MINQLYDEALRLHQSMQLDAAKTLYEKILAQEPQNIDVLHLLGILLTQQDQAEIALTYFKKALKLQSSASLHTSLANTYRHLNKIKKAIHHYQQAIKLDPEHATAYNNLANIYYQQQNWLQAEKFYQQAIALKPQYADAYFNLGLAQLQQQQIDLALQNFHQTLICQPNHPTVHSQLGQCYQQQNELEKACHHYHQQLQLKPNDPETLHRLGTVLIKQGDLAKAVECFENTIKLNPEHAEALHNLGTTYLALNRADKALPCYLKLLQHQPDLDVYYNLGVIYMYQDRHADAINYFEAALNLDPKHFDSLVNLAATNLKQDKITNAVQFYQKAHALQPDNVELNYLLAALTKASTPAHPPAEYIQHLFDHYAPHYDKHLLNVLNYRAHQLLYDVIIDTLQKDNLVIIDLGCGTGLCGELFRPLARHLIGVDLSEKMLAIARQKNIYDELRSEDIHQTLSQSKNIDIILAADVLGYIGDLEDIFKLVYQALTSNGLFAFTVEQCFEKDFELQQTARYAYNPAYIKNLADKRGFKIQSHETAILRTQQRKPVEGHVYLLIKRSIL